MSFVDCFLVAQPSKLTVLNLSGTASASDVVAGKTFYGNTGTLQTGTLIQSGGGYFEVDKPLTPKQKQQIKDSELVEPLEMATAILLIERKQLKQKILMENK